MPVCLLLGLTPALWALRVVALRDQHLVLSVVVVARCVVGLEVLQAVVEQTCACAVSQIFIWNEDLGALWA